MAIRTATYFTPPHGRTPVVMRCAKVVRDLGIALERRILRRGSRWTSSQLP
jgi:hypothetical protein